MKKAAWVRALYFMNIIQVLLIVALEETPTTRLLWFYIGSLVLFFLMQISHKKEYKIVADQALDKAIAILRGRFVKSDRN